MNETNTSNRIKTLRETTKLSQAKFASTYDIPLTTLESWESGKRNPPEYLINLLEKAVEQNTANVEEVSTIDATTLRVLGFLCANINKQLPKPVLVNDLTRKKPYALYQSLLNMGMPLGVITHEMEQTAMVLFDKFSFEDFEKLSDKELSSEESMPFVVGYNMGMFIRDTDGFILVDNLYTEPRFNDDYVVQIGNCYFKMFKSLDKNTPIERLFMPIVGISEMAKQSAHTIYGNTWHSYNLRKNGVEKEFGEPISADKLAEIPFNKSARFDATFRASDWTEFKYTAVKIVADNDNANGLNALHNELKDSGVFVTKKVDNSFDVRVV